MAALRFRPDPRVLVLALCAIPLCFGLGLWQLDRKAQKQALLDFDRQTRALPPTPLEGMSQAAVADLPSGRQVRLRGHYQDERVVLLDNRVHEGRVGYEVLMRFTMADGRSVVVNRGWTPAGADRQDLPTPAAPAGELEIAGLVYRPPGAPLLLGENLAPDTRWPRLVQVVSLPAFERLWGVELLPARIRLLARAPGALVTDWPVVTVPPERHLGYAVQWFGLATALLVLVLYSGFAHRGSRS